MQTARGTAFGSRQTLRTVASRPNAALGPRWEIVPHLATKTTKAFVGCPKSYECFARGATRVTPCCDRWTEPGWLPRHASKDTHGRAVSGHALARSAPPPRIRCVAPVERRCRFALTLLRGLLTTGRRARSMRGISRPRPLPRRDLMCLCEVPIFKQNRVVSQLSYMHIVRQRGRTFDTWSATLQGDHTHCNAHRTR